MSFDSRMNVDCRCNFTLLAYTNISYWPKRPDQSEHYEMPCDVASNFLKQIELGNGSSRGYNSVAGNSHLEGSFHYVTRYELTKLANNGNITYTSTQVERVSKASAKIDLFMKNPGYMPK